MQIRRHVERTRHHWRTARPWAECRGVLFNATRPDGAQGWAVAIRGETASGAAICVALTADETRELRDYLNRLG